MNVYCPSPIPYLFSYSNFKWNVLGGEGEFNYKSELYHALQVQLILK
jgi:hypothetical protein